MTRRRRQTTNRTTAKIGRGLPKYHYIVCGAFERKIKRRPCQPVDSRVGNPGVQCPRPGTPGLGNWGLQCPRPGIPRLGITVRVRTRGLLRRVPFALLAKNPKKLLYLRSKGQGALSCFCLSKDAVLP